jgi:hypothetical protein
MYLQCLQSCPRKNANKSGMKKYTMATNAGFCKDVYYDSWDNTHNLQRRNTPITHVHTCIPVYDNGH